MDSSLNLTNKDFKEILTDLKFLSEKEISELNKLTKSEIDNNPELKDSIKMELYFYILRWLYNKNTNQEYLNKFINKFFKDETISHEDMKIEAIKFIYQKLEQEWLFQNWELNFNEEIIKDLWFTRKTHFNKMLQNIIWAEEDWIIWEKTLYKLNEFIKIIKSLEPDTKEYKNKIELKININYNLEKPTDKREIKNYKWNYNDKELSVTTIKDWNKVDIDIKIWDNDTIRILDLPNINNDTIKKLLYICNKWNTRWILNYSDLKLAIEETLEHFEKKDLDDTSIEIIW